MPRFVYKCKQCDRIYEIECKISEKDVIEKELKCECGGGVNRYFSNDNIPTFGGGNVPSSPTWLKDRLTQINTDLGTNAKTYK